MIFSIMNKENEVYLVVFHFYTFIIVELIYNTYDKKLLAIFKAFKNYLKRLIYSINVIMNYKNLKYFSTTKISSYKLLFFFFILFV